jgi:MFS superfamily sulfate permease-like transporter
MNKPLHDVPRGDRTGFVRHARSDITSGFLVFLIALPLCLGISLACGYPPIAGIFTAIIGAILTPFFSNSELTIKGPAAGLIVIVIGCVQDFGGDGALGGFTETDMAAYRAALAVGVAAAVLQILFGLLRAGILGEFFPVSTVHGMLAAIGVIIVLKQLPVALGVAVAGEPLELLGELPHIVMEANPAIAAIGSVSLLIMFLWPRAGRKVALLKFIPSALVVLVVAVPMGMAFDLLHDHSYTLQGHQYPLGEQYLVSMPNQIFGMFDEITFPAFGALAEPKAWKWVFMFFIIGTLESILSAKAIDLIDPWKRKTNMNRDILAVGLANLAASFLGGLPMISEIVRSRANIDNGARTRFANLWHGLFLLVCVALFPMILHRIPLAALAAMLVYTGYRLAHPLEFFHVYKIGREQLVVFVVTLIAVLATDLLIGIAVGIAAKLCIHIANGVPISSLFRPYLEIVQQDERTCLVRAHHSAVFSNWIPFRRRIEELGLVQRQNVTLDLSHARLVDHSVMEKLHELQREFTEAGLGLTVIGLDSLQPLADHEFSARRHGVALVKRLTVIADEGLEERLERQFVALGISGYTAMDCRGAGRQDLADGLPPIASGPRVRIEVIATRDVCDSLLAFLKTEILPDYPVTVCLETVEVASRNDFTPVRKESLTQHGHTPVGMT